jgi:hypothetical protein
MSHNLHLEELKQRLEDSRKVLQKLSSDIDSFNEKRFESAYDSENSEELLKDFLISTPETWVNQGINNLRLGLMMLERALDMPKEF